MRKINKKAIMFSALLFVFGLMLFGKIYTSLEGKAQALTAGKVVGQNQLAIIESVYDAEKMMLFNDQLSKYTLFDAVFLFADKGAFMTDCGIHGDLNTGYVIWKTKDKECFPTLEVLKSRFRNVFAAEFEGNMKKNPYMNFSKRGTMKHFSYSVDLEDKKTIVRGYAYTPIVNNIYCEYGGEHVPTSWIDKPLPLIGRIFAPKVEKSEALCGNYIFRPSFAHSIKYDLGEYLTIAEKAEGIYTDCKGSTDIFKCVENKMKRVNTASLSWNMTSFAGSAGAILFDFEVRQNNLRFDLYEKPKVRFALAIPVS